jgi:hypothetical protein
MFTKKYTYQSNLTREGLTSRLVGSHVKIHGLDFEVIGEEKMISIIPHAEQVLEIKTLPETYVEFQDENGRTRVTIVSKMRKLDQGGPMLLLILCALLLMVSAVVYKGFESSNHIASIILFGTCMLILTMFIVRLRMGYYDYVSKIHEYIKAKETQN